MQGWIRHLTSPQHSKSPSEGCPRIGDAHQVVFVIPGYAPQISNLLTLASTQHGNTLRIENTGSILVETASPLRSSSRLARDDDDELLQAALRQLITSTIRIDAARNAVKQCSTEPTTHTSLTSSAFSTTSVSPLSCSDDSSDGSWNTYTVTSPVARQTPTSPMSSFLLVLFSAVYMPQRQIKIDFSVYLSAHISIKCKHVMWNGRRSTLYNSTNVWDLNNLEDQIQTESQQLTKKKQRRSVVFSVANNMLQRRWQRPIHH